MKDILLFAIVAAPLAAVSIEYVCVVLSRMQEGGE